MTRRAYEIITAGLTIGIVVLVALNSAVFFFRLDLTENNAFTISEVSRSLFSEIPQEVTITYYVSDRLRNRAVETQQIIDILNEYAAYSRGRINVRIVDPQQAEAVERAEQLGVVPQQIQVIEEDQQSLAVVYTGVVIEYLDDYETLPVVFDPGTVEYRLTSTIRDLVQGEQDVVGVLLGKEGENLENNYGFLANQLSQSFEVRTIRRGEEIPPEVTVLLVIGGPGLDEFDLFPVDQYLMSGGSVLFAVEGVMVDVQRGLSASAPEGMPILELLASYGARVEQELVLDSFNRRIPVRRPSGQVTVQTLEPYPHWVSIRGSGADRENPITARFPGLDLYWPSPITVTADNAEVLLETSPESWLLQEQFPIDPSRPVAFERGRSETLGRHVVGVALTGELESYFSDGRIPTREGEEREWSSPVTSTDQARVVVIGDSDFASNLIQYTESTYNLDFAANALTWLSNDEDLLQIRTRTTRDMRLSAIEEPGLRQSIVRVAEAINIYVMPLLVIAYGVVRFMRRRERAHGSHAGARNESEAE
jgi:gliding-associated putative ABC transporter substrate-binding component GldG